MADVQPHYTNDYTNDEIDLREIWHVLVDGRKIIFLSVLLSLFIASVYLFVVKNEFKAEAYLLPPTEKNIAELNQLSQSDPSMPLRIKLTTAEVYKKLFVYLNSRTLKKKFFDEYNIADMLEVKEERLHKVFVDDFVKKVIVKNVENKKSDAIQSGLLEVSMQLPTTKKNIAELTNNYIKTAFIDTKKEIINDVNSKILNKIKLLNLQIKNKIQLSEIAKNDRISNLKEALVMAKELDIQSPANTNVVDLSFKKMSVNPATPLFYRGAKALKKEIEILSNRKNNMPFISGLRHLENQLSYYRSIVIDESLINVAKVDSWAFPSVDVETPKKRLILFLFVIVGSLLGIFLVFLRSMIKKSGKQE